VTDDGRRSATAAEVAGCGRRGKSLRRGARTVTTAAVTALAAGIAFSTPASANGFGYGNGNGYFYADNANHTWYPWALETASYNALDYAMDTRLASTDMTTDEFQSQDANTDVVAVDVDYGTDPDHLWWGLWQCDSFVSSTQCNKGTMRFNTSWGTVTAALACHETGHSVGLGHSLLTDSCLQDPPPSSDNNFSTHDRSHIDGHY